MISELLQQYKHLIDYSDSMQKNNLKLVERYLNHQQRKNQSYWEKDCVSFLEDAIDLQKTLLEHTKNYRALF